MPGNPYWNNILALEPEISQDNLNEIENMPNLFLDQFAFYYSNFGNFRRAVMRATEEAFSIVYETIHRVNEIDGNDNLSSQSKLDNIIALLNGRELDP